MFATTSVDHSEPKRSWCRVSRHGVGLELTSNAVMFDHSEPTDLFTFVVSLPRIWINTGAAQDPKKIALSFTTIEIIEEFQP
ncbi:MAG: hypothetical protein EB069_05925 [Actinobacteria bacterium]|nr:hypothetical protein [Actinomycetota bacterium]